ncbi:MAG: hypothetical protein II888_05680 [Clostridia bacterium]|nr:hypothetical protein [Clostridia bacterium]
MKLETRFAEQQDLPEIKRQIDEYISPDYYTLEDLQEILRREGTLFYVMTDADREGIIVSYFYAYVAPLREALSDLHAAQPPEALRGWDPETPVGVYKTSSVLREYQQHGICTSFIRDVEPVMRDRGAKMILATAMRSPAGVVPMRHIFDTHGYRVISELIRPWHHLEIYCIYCRQVHCICDAVFYMKELADPENGGQI